MHLPALLLLPLLPAAPPASGSQAASRQGALNLPVHFEANTGHYDKRVAFIARSRGVATFITSRGISLVLTRRVDSPGENSSRNRKRRAKYQRHALQMTFEGASPAVAEGVSKLPGITNYFTGNDPKHWHTHVPNYERVRVKNTYPGIDLEYYANGQDLEYDLIVNPGADPNRIRLRWEGAEEINISTEGNIEIKTPFGNLAQRKPLVYQIAGGRRTVISCQYEKLGSEVGLALGEYDRTVALVIDPVLSYATFLGGNGFDAPWSIAADAAGSTYLTGDTNSFDFPTTTGAFDTRGTGSASFVTKLNPTGTGLVYSTFLGNGGSEAIAVDASGAAHVTGSAAVNFPTTAGAFDRSFNGGGDIFITKLNPSGSALVYSTFVGGTSGDRGLGIALDPSGAAYVAGDTFSTDFPTTPGAYDTSFNRQASYFVTKLNAAGSAMVYSTFLGSSVGLSFGGGIAIDVARAAYITFGTTDVGFPTTPGAFQTAGPGVFVSKLNPPGTALEYSTFLGPGRSTGIALDSTGAAYITGNAGSGFPTTPGAYQSAPGFDDPEGAKQTGIFVSKLNPDGSALLFSTFVGASGARPPNLSNGIAVDASGTAYIGGDANNTDFPTTPGAYDTVYTSGDAFVTRLSAGGDSLLYSTYFGGNSDDNGDTFALDGFGSVYLAGRTFSTTLPVTAGAFDPSPNGGLYDSFVAKLLIPDSGTGGGTAVTLSSTPLGRRYTIAGDGCAAGTYETPSTVQWTSGSPCAVEFATPQDGAAGTRYTFGSWEDIGYSFNLPENDRIANPRIIVTPAAATTYTANFGTQHQLTIEVIGPGSVAPASGGYYDEETTVSLMATSGVCATFSGWSPEVAEGLVTMSSPQSVTATFTPNPAAYTLMPNSTSAPAAGVGGQFQVFVDARCGWSAAAGVSWIAVTSEVDAGNGAVNYVVQANTGPARSGTITVAGQNFTVDQAAAN